MEESGGASLDVASGLHELLSPCFGPYSQDKLLLTAHGKAVITSSGSTILANLLSGQPMRELVVSAAETQSRLCGDGTKSFIIMLSTMLEEAQRQLDCLPVDRQRAWRTKLARAAGWLAQDVLPHTLSAHWRRQAVATLTADSAALRKDARDIVVTALGGHQGTTASAVLAAALVDAVLPAPDTWCSGGEAGPSNESSASFRLIDVARQRIASSRDGGITVESAGGAQAGKSKALNGRLVLGRAASELMPANGASCGVLLLGPHAASPEVATTAEARRAGLPAEIELSVRSAAGGPEPRQRLPAAQAGGVASVVLDAVQAERELWAKSLHSAGVRLVLCGAPLGELTSQRLAAYGICAVRGVDTDDLRALCTAARVSVLQQWPRASQIPALTRRSARFIIDGCDFERVAIGGKSHVFVRIRGSPRLCTLLVRAPSDALAKEYAAAATRALTCLRQWLEPDAVRSGSCLNSGHTRGETSGETLALLSSREEEVLLSLPGGGASELQIEACIRGLLLSASHKHTLAPEQAAALRLLCSALLALPRQLHVNAQRATALDATSGRWPVLLQRLRVEHDASVRCATGLVVTKSADGVGLQRVRDATHAGVLEPLALKLSLLDSVLTSTTQLLGLDLSTVAVHRLPQRRGHSSHRRDGSSRGHQRRRRLDGCSSDDSDSQESDDDTDSHSSSGSDEGILV